jgi:hypothetical protein
MSFAMALHALDTGIQSRAVAVLARYRYFFVHRIGGLIDGAAVAFRPAP